MANVNLLQGEVIEDPNEQKLDVEALLLGLLRSLISEQKSIVEGQEK